MAIYRVRAFLYSVYGEIDVVANSEAEAYVAAGGVSFANAEISEGEWDVELIDAWLIDDQSAIIEDEDDWDQVVEE